MNSNDESGQFSSAQLCLTSLFVLITTTTTTNKLFFFVFAVVGYQDGRRRSEEEERGPLRSLIDVNFFLRDLIRSNRFDK